MAQRHPTQSMQALAVAKNEANGCLRVVPPFTPLEEVIPSHILSVLQQGAANVAKSFLQKRDVELNPFVWCFYLMKGQSVTKTKQVLREMSANNSLVSCKCLLINMLLNSRSWMTTELCLLELLERLLPAPDPHLPVWIVACMMVHSHQVSPSLQLLPVLSKAAAAAVSASRGNPRTMAAASAYMCAPAHKLMLQAYLDPACLGFLVQWINSVKSGLDPGAFATYTADLDVTELDILSGTTGQSAAQARAVLEVVAASAGTPKSSKPFLQGHPWVHLLDAPLAARLLGLLVRQPGPHSQAAASPVLHHAQSPQQLVLVATFLLSAMCQPQALVDLCCSSQSNLPTVDWVVLNSHQLFMLTLDRLIGSINPAGQPSASPCWVWLLAVILNRAPAAEAQFMSLGQHERVLLSTCARSSPCLKHFLDTSPHSSLWTVLVGSCLHWYLNTHLRYDAPNNEAELVAWLILRSCMQCHRHFYAPYHAAACMIAPHLKSPPAQQALSAEDNTAAVLQIVRHDIRYLMTAVSCQLATALPLQEFVMVKADKQPVDNNGVPPSLLAACLAVLRDGSHKHAVGHGHAAPQDMGLNWHFGDAVQMCMKISQQLDPAAFLLMYGDAQGKAVIRHLLGSALAALQGKPNHSLLEYVQAVGDMTLAQPALRQDADVSAAASSVYTFFDDADMMLEAEGSDVVGAPAEATEKVSSAAEQAALLLAGAAEGQAVPFDFHVCKAQQLVPVLGWESLLEAAYKQGSANTSLSWLSWWLAGVAEAVASDSHDICRPLNAFASSVLSSWWRPEWGSFVQEEVRTLRQQMETKLSEQAVQMFGAFAELAVCVMDYGKDLLQWPITTLTSLCTHIPQLSVQCCLACVRSSKSSSSKPGTAAWEADVVPATPPEGTSPVSSLRASGLGESVPTIPVMKHSVFAAAACASQPHAVVDHVVETLCRASVDDSNRQCTAHVNGGGTQNATGHEDVDVVMAVTAFSSAFRSAEANVQQHMIERMEKQISQFQVTSESGWSRSHNKATVRSQLSVLCCVATSICRSPLALEMLKTVGNAGGHKNDVNKSLAASLELTLAASLCCGASSSWGTMDDLQQQADVHAVHDTIPSTPHLRWRPVIADIVLALEPFLGSILLCDSCRAGSGKYACKASLADEQANKQDPQDQDQNDDDACSLASWLQTQLHAQDAVAVDAYVLQALASRMCDAAFNNLMNGLSALMSDSSPLTPDQRAAAGQLRLKVQKQDIWVLLRAPQQGRVPQLRLTDEEELTQQCEVILTAMSSLVGLANHALKVLQWNMGVLLPCISNAACNLIAKHAWSPAQGTALVMICEELYNGSSDPLWHQHLQLLVQCFAVSWQQQLAANHPGSRRTSNAFNQQHTLRALNQVQMTVHLGYALATGAAALAFAQRQIVEALDSTLCWLRAMLHNNSWQGEAQAEELMLSIAEGVVSMFGELAYHNLDIAKQYAATVLPKIARLQAHALIEAGCIRLQQLLQRWGPGVLASTGFLQDTPDDGFLLLLNSSPAVVGIRLGQLLAAD